MVGKKYGLNRGENMAGRLTGPYGLVYTGSRQAKLFFK